MFLVTHLVDMITLPRQSLVSRTQGSVKFTGSVVLNAVYAGGVGL